MHADEIDIDGDLVTRLVAEQFPEWSELAIEPVHGGGTDNALYRLGDDLCVRLPRMPRATGQVEKDFAWLPRLGPALPLAIPVPLARGLPAHGYPWEWGVYRWLDGESATVARLVDAQGAAIDLAHFLAALQRLDPAAGPLPGRSDSSRGVAVRRRDAATRSAIAALGAEVDADAVTAAWEAALRAPDWEGEPVWIHGDLIRGNMLVDEGRLSAVIDFSCLCIGDPACDVMVAWTFLSSESRGVFRAELGVDDATWSRARGWALSFGLIALPYYIDTNPLIVLDARRAITEVLDDEATGDD
jgi:aminoglycoside phosphotransferase (APT) family kinase protein